MSNVLTCFTGGLLHARDVGVHLVGAGGVPTWVMLSAVPLWRWMMDRDDSPWYPSVRLFRQTRAGEWADVIGRVSDALQDFSATAKT